MNIEILHNIAFRQLKQEFGEAIQVENARKLLLQLISEDESELAYLLRDHEVKEITEAETYLRDDVDQYLDYISLIEVGLTAGAFRLNQVDSDNVGKILNNDSVKKYYCDIYPLPLVVRFVSRYFSNFQAFIGTGSPGELAGYASLLAIKRTYEHDSYLNTLLWMLDDGETDDGFTWNNIEILASSLKEFSNALAKGASNGPSSGLEKATLGCRRLLDFITEFSLLLQQVEDFPYLREAIWQNYAYWFSENQYKEKLRSLLEKFESWDYQVPSSMESATPSTTLYGDEFSNPEVSEVEVSSAHKQVATYMSAINHIFENPAAGGVRARVAIR